MMSPSKLRQFGALCVVALAIAAGVPTLRGDPVRIVPAVCAVATLIITWRRPEWLQQPARHWRQLGDLLHRVTSPLFLAVLFFVVMVPTAMLVRLFRRVARRSGPIARRPSSSTQSYWIPRASRPRNDATLHHPY